MIDQLVEILSLTNGVLLGPVLLGLAVLLASTLWTIGGLVREALNRRRMRTAWRAFLAEAAGGRVEPHALDPLPLFDYPAAFRARIRAAGPGSAGARKGLEDIELDMARGLARLTFVSRVGPMLGLMGTLLPLGPALRGLASGRLGLMAGNLEIAFTTTVVGLLIGGIAYGSVVIRRNWYDQDLSDLELVLNRLPPHRSTHGQSTETRSAGDSTCHAAAPVDGTHTTRLIPSPD